MASEPHEWQQAFELLATTYRARGYEAPSAKLIRFTPYHALPDTATFVAKLGDQVVATLSVVLDNTLLGLPIESVFAGVVAELRRCGRRLAEVTSLAHRGLGMREFIPVFVALIRLATQYAVGRGSDACLITINPRHRGFYTKVMGFVPLGTCRSCPSVQDAPAEAYLVDEPRMKATAPQMWQQLFGEELPQAALPDPAMPARWARHFAGQSTQTDRGTVDRVLRFIEQLGNPRRW